MYFIQTNRGIEVKMFTLKISERKGLGKLVMYFSIEEDLSLLSANQSKLKWHYFFSYIWCFNDYNGENLLSPNFPPTCPSCQFVTFFLVPLHSNDDIQFVSLLLPDKSDQCLINLTYQWMYRGPSTLTGIDRTEEETNSPVIHQSCTIQFTGIQYSNWSIFQFVRATRHAAVKLDIILRILNFYGSLKEKRSILWEKIHLDITQRPEYPRDDSMHKIQSRRTEFIDLNINEFVFTDIKLLMYTGKK